MRLAMLSGPFVSTLLPMDTDKSSLSVRMRIASPSRTFHSVRCSGWRSGVSLSWGYLANRPGGSGDLRPNRPWDTNHPSRCRARSRRRAQRGLRRSDPADDPWRIMDARAGGATACDVATSSYGLWLNRSETMPAQKRASISRPAPRRPIRAGVVIGVLIARDLRDLFRAAVSDRRLAGHG